MRDQPAGVHFQGAPLSMQKISGNGRVIGRGFRKKYIYIYSQTSVQTQLHDVTKTGRDVSFAWNEHRKEECDGAGEGSGKPLVSHFLYCEWN